MLHKLPQKYGFHFNFAMECKKFLLILYALKKSIVFGQ